MTFIPFETGLFLTGKNLIKDLNNPVYKCYEIYSNGIRESWDLVTMYYAISKDESLFIKSNKGFVIVEGWCCSLVSLHRRIGCCFIHKS